MAIKPRFWFWEVHLSVVVTTLILILDNLTILHFSPHYFAFFIFKHLRILFLRVCIDIILIQELRDVKYLLHPTCSRRHRGYSCNMTILKAPPLPLLHTRHYSREELSLFFSRSLYLQFLLGKILSNIPVLPHMLNILMIS